MTNDQFSKPVVPTVTNDYIDNYMFIYDHTFFIQTMLYHHPLSVVLKKKP